MRDRRLESNLKIGTTPLIGTTKERARIRIPDKVFKKIKDSITKKAIRK